MFPHRTVRKNKMQLKNYIPTVASYTNSSINQVTYSHICIIAFHLRKHNPGNYLHIQSHNNRSNTNETFTFHCEHPQGYHFTPGMGFTVLLQIFRKSMSGNNICRMISIQLWRFYTNKERAELTLMSRRESL